MLDSVRWPDADAVLDRALELPEDQRHAYVARAAAHDQELLRALELVLGEVSSRDGFLEPGGALSGPLGTEIGRELASAPATTLLRTGMRLEHYQVVGLLGRGGMGEVYRARDTRLGRDVALKVLPTRFADDVERIARFRREAQVLASLNHPGIGRIYGLTAAGDTEALVLELVEGPTIAERLDRGPLAIAEVLAIGRRLAEALEAAHAQGILHRDLKPGNIKLTPDGGVKILDFGLGKSLAPTADASGAGADLTAGSPGSVLGTAAYMSPEQARGAPLDQRTDIWAFGCVLFEMLSGVRAFPGRSVPEVLSRVFDEEPPFDRLPDATPRPLRRLLRRTLAKEPSRRLGYIGDALLEFDDAAAPDAGDAVRRSPGYLAIGALLAAVAAAALAAWMWRPHPQPAPAAPPLARFVVPLPDNDTPVTGFEPMTALSPDGRTIVYAASRAGVTQLFRRDLDQIEARPIAGTINGKAPFFSPDGSSLGFAADGLLKQIALAGGAPKVICPAPGDVTASWSARDEIIFSTTAARVLQRVPADGGTPVPITVLDPARGEQLHLLPQALAGGETIVFTIASEGGRHIGIVRADGAGRTVVAEGSHGRFLPSGHLVFWRDESLWAAAFDPLAPAEVDAPVRIMGGIEHAGDRVLHFDVSANGSMVYLPAGSYDVPPQRLVWIDRTGRELRVDLEPRPYLAVDVAPDGRRLALAIREQGNTDVWIATPAERTMSQLTVEPSSDDAPVWSRDGQFVMFRSDREPAGLYRRDARGSRPIEAITAASGLRGPIALSPDGRRLWSTVQRSGGSAIVNIPVSGGPVEVVLESPATLLDPRVSPDGRWLAYQSDESGRFEIYVAELPAAARPRRWSVDGGRLPRWSPDGRELFYVDGSGLRAVPFDGARPPTPPARLFAIGPSSESGADYAADYIVAGGAKEFLFALALEQPAGAARLVLVQQWMAEVVGRLNENTPPARLR